MLSGHLVEQGLRVIVRAEAHHPRACRPSQEELRGASDLGGGSRAPEPPLQPQQLVSSSWWPLQPAGPGADACAALGTPGAGPGRVGPGVGPGPSLALPSLGPARLDGRVTPPGCRVYTCRVGKWPHPPGHQLSQWS